MACLMLLEWFAVVTAVTDFERIVAGKHIAYIGLAALDSSHGGWIADAH